VEAAMMPAVTTPNMLETIFSSMLSPIPPVTFYNLTAISFLSLYVASLADEFSKYEFPF
jgi:hypothetical protein